MMFDFVRELNGWAVGGCQLLAIFVICIGSIKALWIFVKDALFGLNSAEAIRESRMELGHSFSLGLGFLIGGSILNTTLAPTWTEIGQLSAIIAIRTFLNHFLLRDIERYMNTVSVVSGDDAQKTEPDDSADTAAAKS